MRASKRKNAEDKDMLHRKKRVSSSLPELDRLLGSLFIGDNVVWYDEAGSLAHLFCYHLIRDAVERTKPVIYVSFDHSPKSILEKLGPLRAGPVALGLDFP